MATRPSIEGFLLSLNQQRLWTLQTSAEEIYRSQIVLRLDGQLYPEQLKRALQVTLKRHQSLKTSFCTVDALEYPLQVIAEDVSLQLQILSLPGLSEEQQEQRIERILRGERQLAVDLSEHTFLRAILVTYAENLHFLVLSIPSLVVDGPSLHVLVHNIMQFYTTEALPGEEENMQYLQFSEWQQMVTANGGFDEESEEMLWQRELAFTPLPLRLLTHVDEASRAHSGSFVTTALTFEESARIQDMAAHYQVAPTTILFACWLILLQRMSNQQEIEVGYQVSGRTYEELQELCGLLVRYLPIKTMLPPDLAFTTFVSMLEQTLREEEKHQDRFAYLPVTGVTRNTSATNAALFSAAFDYQDMQLHHQLPGGTWSLWKYYSCTEPFDIRLSCMRHAHTLAFSMQSDTHIVQEEQLERLTDSFLTVVHQIIHHPKISLEQIEIIGSQERQKILTNLSQGQSCLLPDRHVHQLFEGQAARTPENIAGICNAEVLTYAQLDVRSNQLAHFLRQQGVGPETRIGICLDNTLELLIGLLGILKAGGAYVPLDPTYPQERLMFMLQDAQVPVLITTSPLLAKLPPYQGQQILLDVAASTIASQSTEHLANVVSPENIAYIIYTSGSTGKPKGAMVTHAGLTNYLAWCTQTYTTQGGPGSLVYSSTAFDFTVTSIFAPLVVGLAVTLIARSSSLEALNALLATHEPFTFLKLTPAHIRILSRQLTPEVLSRCARVFIVGGEELLAEDIVRWDSSEGIAIWNEYGPTETVVGCSVYCVQDDFNETSVPIGYPIINSSMYVLDQRQQLAPLGVSGEIYVGGAGVSRGYLHRPDLTAERYVPDPFSTQPGARLYRTGDMGYYLPDGNLQFTGRVDSQVKVRGFRVELGEIEATLKQHPALQDVVVVARDDQPRVRGKRLIAYVVKRPERQDVAISELRAFAQQQLPDYMLPAVYMFVASFPLTAHGKIDRAALPQPELERSQLESAYAQPLTEVEEILAGIWSQVLEIEHISIHDNYFALGGDSIRSIQVVALAKERGLNLSVERVFDAPTVYEQARWLQANTTQNETNISTQPFALISPHDRDRLPDDVENAYQLSELQAGMIFHKEYNPHSPIYHDVASFYLQAPLQIDKMKEAIELLQRRHLILRTSFDLSSYSEPLQLVHKKGGIELAISDMQHLSEAEQNATIAAWLEEEKSNSFASSSWPLIRFYLHVRTRESYQFTVSFHHAILDGWSDASMISELFHSYLSILKGESVSAEPPVATYQSFVALEQQALASREQEEFWQHKLDGVLPMTLPRWKTIEAHQVYVRTIIEHEVSIPEEVSQGLKRLALTTAVPVKDVLLAAHLYVMGVLGGTQDVLTCIVSSGREEERDGEKVLGLFLNSMPFRLQLSGGTWQELIQATFNTEREMIPYRRYPMAKIKREKSGAPLSETLFYFTHYHVYQSLQDLPDVQLLDDFLYEESSFALATNFSINPFTSRVQLKLKCDGGQLSLEQVELMGGYYSRVLAAIASTAEARYETFSPLGDQERELMLRAWNATQVPYPDEQSIQQLFEQQVVRTPDAIAVVYKEQYLSYYSLNQQANQLAHYLRQAGIGPDMRVGLCLERSIDLLVGVLGILKAGGAYVPLDPAYPQERLAFMLQDAQIPLLLTRERLVAQLPEHTAGTVLLDADWGAIARHSQENPCCLVNAENLAYVNYTSGSTGVPKGVEVRQRGVLRLVFGGGYAQLDERQTHLQLVPMSFDVATFELWGPLLHGGRCVLFPGEKPTIQELEQVLSIHGVNTLWLTTSLFNVVIDEAPQILKGVRQLLIGGEALSVSHVRRALESLPDTQIINGYGPTENTTFSCCYTIEDALPAGARSVPIGSPIGNTQAYVVDQHGQPVPIGVPGELYLGGPGLARGYLNRPALTAERFVPDWLSGQPGERLYQTGDLARYLPDGTLDFLGRLDQQVKLRGFRIEPGEIEAVLDQHSGVREALVMLREDIPGQKRLVAYVVGEPEQPVLHPEELRQLVQEHLPDYMVPSSIVLLETFPLTPSGKLDRHRLPSVAIPQAEESVAFDRPRNEIEDALIAIWQDVLGLKQVSLFANFFEMGGHSLLATRIISSIRKLWQVELPLRDMFVHPTIAALAAEIERARHVQHALLLPRLQPLPHDRDLPLSFAQQRLWFLDQLGAGAMYNVLKAVRIEGPLNLLALRHSLNTLMRRHEALRTTFPVSEGEPRQRIAAATPIALPFIDLQALPDPERERQVLSLAQQEQLAPFDLDRGPLVRVWLVHLAPQQYALIVMMHHIVTDGWSIGLIQHEITELYQAFCNGQPAVLPSLSVQYADYTLWQRQWLQGEVLQQQLNYWKQQLSGAPDLLKLPWDHPRPAEPDSRGAIHAFQISASLSNALRLLSREEEVTLFMSLFSAFQVLLQRYSGQSDIVVGTPVANRIHPETEGIVGFFANTLALRTDLSEDPPLRQVLRRVKETVLEAYEHQDLPFEQVVKALQPERTLSYAPLLQVMFVQLPALPPLNKLGEIQIHNMPIGVSTAKFDLDLEVQEQQESIMAFFKYNTELFDSETIQRMEQHYQRILAWLVSSPHQPISTIPLLGDQERNRMLIEWNATQMPFPDNQCVHELFERQVDRTPDAVAVVYGEQQLSYRQLNGQANQLAHYLRQVGVGRGTLVGLCVERNLDMPVAVLGILKAGGAYIPLDASYPQERLDYMLTDSQVKVLVTQVSLQSRWSTYQDQVQAICLDRDRYLLAEYADQNLKCAVTAQDLAYMIYTSGSTGRPKGVLVEHSGLCNVIQAQISIFNVQPGHQVLQFASLSFDASIFELCMALFAGASLHLGTAEALQPGPNLHQFLQERSITHVTLTPTVLKILPPQELPMLQTVVSAGEMCSPDILARWAIGRQFFNAYGPTEATIWSTIAACNAGEKVTIGRPIFNTQLYVLDAGGQPVPIGVAGELFIGGSGIARGYYQRPELTAERFVPDPFSQKPGARLYHTGDLVRYNSDGSLEFLGRIDQQVKVRGIRVELGEIKEALCKHPAVQDAVVSLHEDTNLGTSLIAYLVPAFEPVPSSSQFRAFLANSLPVHMLPSHFQILQELPRTPNGKLDTHALPPLDSARYTPQSTSIAPRDLIELQLADIWESLLHLDAISVTDNFFDLGGHSLLAAHMMAQISRQFGRDLPLATLFQQATIEHLARLIRQQGETPPQSALVAIRSRGAKSPFFCVHPVGGGVLCYRDLAHSLDQDRPFYALQALEWDVDQGMFTPLEAMAAHYIAAIRALRPDGPYHLGGWSMGGVIAFEMAQQLQQQGLEVGSLTLLDSYVPTQLSGEEDILAEFLEDVERFLGVKLSFTLTELQHMSPSEQIEVILERAKQANVLPLDMEQNYVSRLFRIFQLNKHALRDYIPRPYYGQLTLLQARNNLPEKAEVSVSDWRALATRGVTVHNFEGDHYTMLQHPHVKSLAQYLSNALEEAEER